MNVLLIGASEKPHRYAYRAFQLLSQAGHHVIPVHPRLKQIDGVVVVASLKEVLVPVDTVTLYVSAVHSVAMIPDILALHPRRIILNPGAENDVLERAAQAAGIETLQACTLVLLQTGQF